MIDLSSKETSALTPDSYVKASDVRLNSGLEGKRGDWKGVVTHLG